MTSSNLVARVSHREITAEVNVSRLNSAAMLRDVFRHGDPASIASTLAIGRPRMGLMLAGDIRNPFEGSALVVETLKRNGNPNWREPLLWLARRLGFVAYEQNANSIDDINFADAMREFADVITVRAEAERDGKITSDERRAIARECDEAIERLAQFRDKQLSAAKESR